MSSPPHRAKTSTLRAAAWWATTAAWIITIYGFSTDVYSDSLTELLLSEFLRMFNLQIAQPDFNVIHQLMRKSAHVTAYGLLALLLYGSMGGGGDFRWRGRRAAWCVLLAGGYSRLDELHQWFVPSRTGSLADSTLDTGGAFLAMAGVYIVGRIVQATGKETVAGADDPGRELHPS